LPIKSGFGKIQQKYDTEKLKIGFPEKSVIRQGRPAFFIKLDSGFRIMDSEIVNPESRILNPYSKI